MKTIIVNEDSRAQLQYRLSTLFLVFFFVAASLALFGLIGLWLIAVLGAAALIVNRAKTASEGICSTLVLVFMAIICPGFALSGVACSAAREAARRAECNSNLKQIGTALLSYQEEHRHFPAINDCSSDGKPLWSWLVELLPELERKDIYDRLRMDEPWDSPKTRPF
jgi:hypothetical protein